MKKQILEHSGITLHTFQLEELKKNKLENIINLAINQSTHLLVNDIVHFDKMKFEVTSQPYNSGLVEERYIIEVSKKNSSKITQLLLDSILMKLETDIFAWELYNNKTIIVACNIIQGHIIINESLTKK